MISHPRTLALGGLMGGYHENFVHGRTVCRCAAAASGTCSASGRSRWPASRTDLSQVLGSGGPDRGRSEKSPKAAAITLVNQRDQLARAIETERTDTTGRPAAAAARNELGENTGYCAALPSIVMGIAT